MCISCKKNVVLCVCVLPSSDCYPHFMVPSHTLTHSLLLNFLSHPSPPLLFPLPVPPYTLYPPHYWCGTLIFPPSLPTSSFPPSLSLPSAYNSPSQFSKTTPLSYTLSHFFSLSLVFSVWYMCPICLSFHIQRERVRE